MTRRVKDDTDKHDEKLARLVTQAVAACREAIQTAVASRPPNCGNAGMMERMVLDTLTAEMLANGRETHWAADPLTGYLGSSVQILINHGTIAENEPVLQHFLSVMYLLGEEDNCKAVHEALRMRTWIPEHPVQ